MSCPALVPVPVWIVTDSLGAARAPLGRVTVAEPTCSFQPVRSTAVLLTFWTVIVVSVGLSWTFVMRTGEAAVAAVATGDAAGETAATTVPTTGEAAVTTVAGAGDAATAAVAAAGETATAAVAAAGEAAATEVARGEATATAVAAAGEAAVATAATVGAVGVGAAVQALRPMSRPITRPEADGPKSFFTTVASSCVIQ